MTRRIAVFVLFVAFACRSVADEKNKGLTPKQRASARIAVQAATAMQKGDWDRGIRLCDLSLRQDPENVNARWMRGLGHLKKREFDQAVTDFTDVLRRDADMAPAYRDRGIAYAEKKEYDKAIDDFNQYIKRRPNDPEGYRERGNAYEKKGDKENAEADFRKEKELRAAKK